MKRRFAAICLVSAIIVTTIFCSSCNVSSNSFEPTFSAAIANNTDQAFHGAPLKISLTGFSVDDDAVNASYFIPLNKILQQNHWGITIAPEYVDYTDKGEQQIVNHIKSLQASGAEISDAYIVDKGGADQLGSLGFAKELGNSLPEAAPTLFGRISSTLNGSLYGIPINPISQTRRNQLALLVESEYAGQLKVNNMDDVFDFLNNNPSYQIITHFLSTLPCWAYEQGYYDLGDYGINGFLFARYDDPDCTPVPVETIPGFAAYAQIQRSFVASKRFIENPNEFSSPNIIGYLGTIDRPINTKPNVKYVAFPLLPRCPVLPDDHLCYQSDVVISNNCKDPSAIIKFIEWVYLDQDNYDLINYGTINENYRLVNNCFEPLLNGKSVPYTDWGNDFFFNSYNRRFADCKYERAAVSPIVNRTEAYAALVNIIPPIWDKIGPLSQAQSQDLFKDLLSENQLIMSTRANILMRGLFNAEIMKADDPSIETSLQNLSLLDNQKLLDACKQKMAEVFAQEQN